jgi:hypothetical protein
MFPRIPVLNAVTSMLHRPDARLQASLSLARLMSQLDLEAMPFEEGVQASRRDAETRHVAIGIWLIPLDEKQNADAADMKKAIPATTCDLRRNGIGVLTPARLGSKKFVVAVADLENAWKFFVAETRHQSDRPGGWHQLGLHVEKIWQPGSMQIVQFRHRVENIFQEA